MKVGRNRVTGILLAIVGIIVVVLVSQFKMDMALEYPGPKLFPLIAGVGLILLGIGISFEKDDDKKIQISKTFIIRSVIVVVCTSLYVLALKYFGFLISSPVFVFITAALFSKASPENKSKWWHWLIFAIVITAFVYVVYVFAFSLRLPRGKITKF